MHFLRERGFEHRIPSDITPPEQYAVRRQWLREAGLLATVAVSGGLGVSGTAMAAPARQGSTGARKLSASASRVPGASSSETRTSYRDATSYNNFYEFGTGKSDPARNAGRLHTSPWTVRIEGAVHKPLTLGIEDLLRLAPLEQRVYRLRCVEGWSMVIPWVGYSLSNLLRRVEPTGSARFVEFETLGDAAQMPGLRSSVLQWPYTEGLRLDEAMHPLTLLALGMYGEVLPAQNGAPVRLVVPWKYGFKSAKSLVRIRLTEQMPRTAWNKVAPTEYGFYSNVNPSVPHPRWSQATERRIGDSLWTPRRKTQLFNGYAPQVASLYAGMDLAKNF